MREYFGEAIILDREPAGDLDARISFFTKGFGKITAKAKSVRKINSKLSGHLVAGNLVDLRIIEKNGLQVVDALKKNKLPISLADLYFLNRILPEMEPDPRLWCEFLSSEFNWQRILKILGWDPQGATCQVCSSERPAAFGIRDQEFSCKNCSLKLDRNELIFI